MLRIGGKDVVVAEDLPQLDQIALLCFTVYEVLKFFGWEMFHLQLDGHVHPTGKETKCLIISYFRALTVAEAMTAAGVPSKVCV